MLRLVRLYENFSADMSDDVDIGISRIFHDPPELRLDAEC